MDDHLRPPEGLKIDRQLQEETNPVSRTAETTLFQLAEGGDKDAAAIAAKLGLTFEGTQTFGSDRMAPEDAAAFRIVLEVRYRTMARLAEESGCGTIADLPCGYTPLAAEVARKGRSYLGLDLPAVISEVGGIVPPMVPEALRERVRFRTVDATNDQSMREAFSPVDSSLCVLTSGLLMYFSDPEIEAMVRCVREALDRHGGCWIVADPEVEMQHFPILKILSGDRYDRLMKERPPLLTKKSDTALGHNVLTIHPQSRKEDLERASAFLLSRGLRTERLIVADHMPENDPASFSLLSEGQRKGVLEVFRNTAFWRITSDGSARAGGEGAEKRPAENAAFRVRAVREGSLLTLELAGRLDTLSAPELLALYQREAASGGIRKVVFVYDGLSFISSAGLRVLLMIRKGCADGIVMAGVRAPVREILVKSGLEQLLAPPDVFIPR